MFKLEGGGVERTDVKRKWEVLMSVDELGVEGRREGDREGDRERETERGRQREGDREKETERGREGERARGGGGGEG